MSLPGGGGIFVSYRREESSHLAGRLYDRLAAHFGGERVFIDVDTIEPGVDFAEEIFRAVAGCRVLLAIIGPSWLRAADAEGGRRLDNPDDIVRLEIEAALTRAVRVIPILVDGAVMPTRQELPESLASLARRNALPIRHESFRYDAGRLVAAIERVLAALGGGAASSALGIQAAGQIAGEVQQDSVPARNDAARAARLLAEAERLANSLPNESPKAWALSDVARALAAIDPGRAAQLLAEAERLANSMTDEYSKAWALSGVARALAATDPGRAAQLLAEAERLANSITGESFKASALGAVVEALAAVDPGRAERIANSITNGYWKAAALSDVARALAATDLGRAAQLLAEAERLANSITDQHWKAWVLSGVARALAATDLGRAAQLLAEAERLANSMTDGYWKAWALSGVAQVLAATDLGRAAQLLAEAERLANSLSNESLKASALSGVARALVAMSS